MLKPTLVTVLAAAMLTIGAAPAWAIAAQGAAMQRSHAHAKPKRQAPGQDADQAGHIGYQGSDDDQAGHVGFRDAAPAKKHKAHAPKPAADKPADKPADAPADTPAEQPAELPLTNF